MKKNNDLRKYIVIEPFKPGLNEEPGYVLWLKVGFQQFRIITRSFEDKKEAEWFAEALLIALTNIVEDEKTSKDTSK